MPINSPSKKIYNNSIDTIEKESGLPLIDREGFIKTLQQAWDMDKTNEKTEFVQAYSNLYTQALKEWTKHASENYMKNPGLPMPDYGNFAWLLEKHMKLCAMTFIPQLRTNEDLLLNITFGGIVQNSINKNIYSVTKNYNIMKETERLGKERIASAYDKVKDEWANKHIREIAGLAYDKEKLSMMSEAEKTDYLIALYELKRQGFTINSKVKENEKAVQQKLDENQSKIIDDAIKATRNELKIKSDLTLEEHVYDEYFKRCSQIVNFDTVHEQTSKVVAEYNKNPTPAKNDIAQYKALVSEMEKTRDVFLSDEKIEVANEMLAVEDVKNEISNPYDVKEKEYLDERIKAFNEEYGLKVNAEKFRNSVNQISVLMLVAREEKEDFLATDGIIEINEGKEKVTSVEEFNKKYYDYSKGELVKKGGFVIEKNGENVNQIPAKEYVEKNKFTKEEFEKFVDPNNVVVVENGKETIMDLENYNKEFSGFENFRQVSKGGFVVEKNDKTLKFNKARNYIRDNKLTEEKKKFYLRPNAITVVENGKEKFYNVDQYNKEIKGVTADEIITEGGFVIEKVGKTTNRLKISQYFETHETAKEQAAYKEYQGLYKSLYKDACKREKERNYQKGMPTDFAKIAKSVDELLKTALFEARIYDNEKNKEIVQKCSFGGFTAEQLTNLAVDVKNENWEMEQNSVKAWKTQSAGAKNILSRWFEGDKSDWFYWSSIKRMKNDVKENIDAYKNNNIDKKEMLDYTIAAEGHLQNRFPTRRKKILSFIQYLRERKVVRECRKALGIGKNDSLRVEMSKIYAESASKMSKEAMFESLDKTITETASFDDAKKTFTLEHNEIMEKAKEERMNRLNELENSNRQKIYIEELDEKKAIVNAQPKSKPISMDLSKQMEKVAV